MGRPQATKPANWDEVMKQWKAGDITAVKAMELTGTKRTTFYKLAKRENTMGGDRVRKIVLDEVALEAMYENYQGASFEQGDVTAPVIFSADEILNNGSDFYEECEAFDFSPSERILLKLILMANGYKEGENDG